MPQLLNPHDIATGLQSLQLPGRTWAVEGQALMASWSFIDFQQAFSFMTLAAETAERMNHHPEWTHTYNHVHVRLSTHDAGGLTALDFDLAHAMQALADGLLDTANAGNGKAAWGLDTASLVQHWVTAFNQEQLTDMTQCYAPDALLWGTHALQCIQGRDVVTQYFKNVFDSGRRVRVSLTGLQATGGFHRRIAHGSYRFDSTPVTGPVVLSARFSFVWQFQARGWQIQSHHSSAMPAQT